MHKTTLKERREKKAQSLQIHNARTRGMGWRKKVTRLIKKQQAQAGRDSVTKAAEAAKAAIAADPALGVLSDEELAARNLAAAK